MAHYARIIIDKVVQVIVAEPEFLEKYKLITEGKWVQTSYNTYGGEHRLGGIPLRKNFASVGFTYDVERDAFIPPKEFDSWILNEDTCLWESPIPMPTDETKAYDWDEESTSWIEVTL